jgi:uncharacterized repeat protein (TIGR03837 family)
MRTSWDIFCHIVDNYGDAGVCWRLARQLAAEYDADVRIWVDDLTTFNLVSGGACLDVSAELPRLVDGVWLHLWSTPWPANVLPADVVLETFACELPADYVGAMAVRELPSLWLNLEYLSAEEWVSACHGLPSLQANSLQKFFFFPGFNIATGGLLREAGLLQRRREFQRSASARAMFLESIAVSAVPGARLVSLFCYENPALSSWLNAMSAGDLTYHILVPEGRVVPGVCAWLGQDAFKFARVYRQGNVAIQFIPFLSQCDYDRLLWNCDFNVVRGEDSFVRAQWAGRPFLWHIYPQQDNTHLIKLDAFLSSYTAGLGVDEKATLVARWTAWNSGQITPSGGGKLFAGGVQMAGHAEDWCTSLESQKNLAQSLVDFYQNWVS